MCKPLTLPINTIYHFQIDGFKIRTKIYSFALPGNQLYNCWNPFSWQSFLQEFGGKNYEASMIYVNEFVRTLLSSNELLDFEQIRAFLDEDYKANDKFTASFIHWVLQFNLYIFFT